MKWTISYLWHWFGIDEVCVLTLFPVRLLQRCQLISFCEQIAVEICGLLCVKLVLVIPNNLLTLNCIWSSISI